MTNHDDIRIGTMAGKGVKTPEYIKAIAPHGFECFQVNFWQKLGGVNLKQLARKVLKTLDEAGTGAVVSSLGMFGNPLEDKNCAKAWAKCIDTAHDFGCDLVCGFAGAATGQSVADSIKPFKKVFGPLAKRAEDKGVRLAFENCTMGGTWSRTTTNIAFCPDAWELMFDAVPSDAVGLEWEPCHQMVQLIDPIPQLKEWAGYVFHVHGKDATVDYHAVQTRGINAPEKFVQHRTPGFGDTNWTDVISILRQSGFVGAIDIEGWHDPVYRDELEMTGQVHALHYLRACRGGDFIANPKGL